MGFLPKRRQRHAKGEPHPHFDLPGLVVRRRGVFATCPPSGAPLGRVTGLMATLGSAAPRRSLSAVV